MVLKHKTKVISVVYTIYVLFRIHVSWGLSLREKVTKVLVMVLVTRKESTRAMSRVQFEQGFFFHFLPIFLGIFDDFFQVL